MRLANRRVLITGGGSGIGLATATLFAAQGARLAILDRSPTSLDRARAQFPDAAVEECVTKAMAIDLGPDKIRVNVVCPGLIDTPLVKDTSHGPTFSPEQYQKLMERRILRRMGEARELADAILFLTSGESSFITATTLAVDGGGSMH